MDSARCGLRLRTHQSSQKPSTDELACLDVTSPPSSSVFEHSAPAGGAVLKVASAEKEGKGERGQAFLLLAHWQSELFLSVVRV